MIWLALLIGFWAVYGTGKQVGHDAREGLHTARQRAAARSAAIRNDKRAPAWKRRTVTATHYTGKVTGATFRGVRYAGRSAVTGARWGVAEGRRRHAEREELRAARPLSDADDPTAYRQVRDRILHNRAQRRGVGVPARKVARIEKRDAKEDKRRAAAHPEEEAAPEPTEPERVEHCDSCGNTTDACVCGDPDLNVRYYPRPDTEPLVTGAPSSGKSRAADLYDGWPRRDGDERDAYRVTTPDGDSFVNLDGLAVTYGDGYTVEPVRGESRTGGFKSTTNGGTATMTAPTSNGNGTSSSEPPKGWFDHIIDHGKAPGGYSGNGHSGEATTISGARAAWGSFQHDAVEMYDSATTAETEADARMVGAAALLDTAAAAETDAQTCSQRAEMLAASMADGDMGDPQAIADAQQQQEFAASLANAAATLRAEAEASQAQAAKIKQLGAALRSAAEASQAHAAQAVAGMNARMARREAFFKD